MRALVAGLAGVLALVGGGTVALTVLAVVGFGIVTFTALAQLGAARYRRHHPPSCPADEDAGELPWPARFLAACALFARECAATALLVITLPLPTPRARVGERHAADDRRPVLLLHGYAQRPALLFWLARALRRDGWTSCVTVRHRPLWGDIEASAAALRTAIDDFCRATGASTLDVVAHSMGGLVARAYVRASGDGRVARLITLGTPHQGTEAFRDWTVDPMVAQMRPDSPFLRALASNDPVPSLTDCISIYSTDDAVVVPAGNAYYPGAFNIAVRGLGHLSLLFSHHVYVLIRENLVAELTPRARAS